MAGRGSARATRSRRASAGIPAWLASECGGGRAPGCDLGQRARWIAAEPAAGARLGIAQDRGRGFVGWAVREAARDDDDCAIGREASLDILADEQAHRLPVG